MFRKTRNITHHNRSTRTKQVKYDRLRFNAMMMDFTTNLRDEHDSNAQLEFLNNQNLFSVPAVRPFTVYQPLRTCAHRRTPSLPLKIMLIIAISPNI